MHEEGKSAGIGPDTTHMNYSRATFESEFAAIRNGDMRQWLSKCVGTPVFALVNVARCDAPALATLCQDFGLEMLSLFDNTPEEDHASTGPHLIAMPQHCSAELLDGLALQCAVKDALSLIASFQPVYRLVAHLQSWFNGVLDGKTDVLVRYFDPRIGFDLMALLPAVERHAFLEPLQFWAGWKADFSPIVMPGSATRAAAARAQPLPISKEMAMALGHINTADLILGLITEEDLDGGELDPIAPALQRHIAQRQLAQVHAVGLSAWADQRFWVGMGLRINAMLGDVETGRAWLSKAKQDRVPLSTLLIHEPEELWARAKARAPQALGEVAQKFLTSLKAQPRGLAMTP